MMKLNPQYPCPHCQKCFTQAQLRRRAIFSGSLQCPHCLQKLRAVLPRKHRKHLFWLCAGGVLISLLLIIKSLFPDFIGKGIGDALSLVIFLYCGAWHGLKLANHTVYYQLDN